MQTIRRAQDRGQARFDGVRSEHSFSFGQYYDPAHMGFGALRVINEDRVAPGGGFPAHAHQDMEIISLVRSGSMIHQDSLGHGSVIHSGDVQRMSAGSGIRHSEFNASIEEPLEFLQIWIVPSQARLVPSYEQKSFARTPSNALTLIGSQQGREHSIIIHQDVDLYLGSLTAGGSVRHSLGAGRIAWLQMMSGQLNCGADRLTPGDGLAISHTTELMFSVQADSGEETQFLLFDMHSR